MTLFSSKLKNNRKAGGAAGVLIILRHGQRSLLSAEQNPERRPAVVADGGFAVGKLELPDGSAFGQRVKMLRRDG